MKVLSIKQPWSSLIIEGIKPIENRTWYTDYRGKILVHVSSPTKFNVQLSDERTILALPIIKQAMEGTLPFGAIIGEVDTVDCVQNHPSIWADRWEIKNRKQKDGSIIPVQVPVWNWVLANPVKYDQPILDVKGALSLWNYDL